MIPEEIIKDILSKADIVQIISSYLNVIKKSSSYVALCPFHDDKNPSLSISPSKQIYKCFVCGNGGNVFTFVQNYEKISYIQAVKKVASLIGYTSPYLLEEARPVSDKNKQILKSLKDASDFYHYVLSTQVGKSAKEYFSSRNISDDMINYFNLGFSPLDGELTIKQLRSKNNEVQSLEKAGILIHDKSSFSDRFKGRVIFPIYNEFDEVIGFSGRRLLDNDEAKYVNSPASELFNKSGILYNYQNAKKESKQASYCYIVEGFMDVFALYEAGIKSSVALMGTAFTSLHARFLKRLGVEIRLFLDGDDAGQKAIFKMADVLSKENVPYRIVNYNGDLRDPDEILNQDGKEALLNLSKSLQSKNDFLISILSKNIDLTTIEGKRKFVASLSKYGSNIENEIEYEAFIDKIYQLIHISKDVLRKEINKQKEEEIFVPNINEIKSKKKINRLKRIQRQLIYYMLSNEDAFNYIRNSSNVAFVDDIYLLLSNYIEEIRNETSSLNEGQLIAALQINQEDDKAISEVVSITSDDAIPPYEEEIVEECLQALASSLKKQNKEDIFAQEAYTSDEITRAKFLDEHKN